jgi:hypothetical protein
VIIGTWPGDEDSPIFIRGYEGRTYEDLIEAFHEDAVLLLAQGYEPAGQHYIQGEWGFWRMLLATLLIPFFFIGVLLWGQMLVQRPIGVLTVTYVHRGEKS